MWTFLIGLFLFVGLAMAALYLGQAARRHFPKAYATFDRTLSVMELVFYLVVFFGLFYLTR